MDFFLKIELCLLHSDFVFCMENFCKNSLQQSKFNAYKIYMHFVKTCKKCLATYNNNM